MNEGHAIGGIETVLLVDDEKALRSIGKRVLAAKGYIVLTAEDGPEALRVLERHGRPVDLLITDVVLPGMSGPELAKRIGELNLARRTLFVSGYGQDAIVDYGVPAEGLEFLPKPFSPESLLRKTREVLDGPADGKSRTVRRRAGK